MENSVCSSDDEKTPKSKTTKKKMTLIDFDRQILKAISEQSIASLVNQSTGDNLQELFFTSTPIANNSKNIQKRNSMIVKSTPNLPTSLSTYEDKLQETPVKLPRRYMKRYRQSANYNYDTSTVTSTPNLSSFHYTKDDEPSSSTSSCYDTNNKKEPSTLVGDNNGNDGERVRYVTRNTIKLNYSKSFNDSFVKYKANDDDDDDEVVVDDDDDKRKGLDETRSMSGSINSKGVHFCPIVSEVNWKDEHASNDEHETSSNTTTITEQSSPDRDEMINNNNVTSTASINIVKPSTLYDQQLHNQNQKERNLYQIPSSSSEREINDDDLPFFLKRNDNKELIRPEPRKLTQQHQHQQQQRREIGFSLSQPDLNTEKRLLEREEETDILNNGVTKSEDDLSVLILSRLLSSDANDYKSHDLKRRGSQSFKR